MCGIAGLWDRRGQTAPDRGLRFDADKVLLDPYGRGVVVPPGYDRQAAGFQYYEKFTLVPPLGINPPPRRVSARRWGAGSSGRCPRPLLVT